MIRPEASDELKREPAKQIDGAVDGPGGVSPGHDGCCDVYQNGWHILRSQKHVTGSTSPRCGSTHWCEAEDGPIHTCSLNRTGGEDADGGNHNGDAGARASGGRRIAEAGDDGRRGQRADAAEEA